MCVPGCVAGRLQNVGDHRPLVSHIHVRVVVQSIVVHVGFMLLVASWSWVHPHNRIIPTEAVQSHLQS